MHWSKPLVFVFLMITGLSYGQRIHVLGIAQDAGHPQIDCDQSCCSELSSLSPKSHFVTSLAIETEDAVYLIDATPDITDQWNLISKTTNKKIEGIFLTHGHIGHYSGLMYLGREAMGAEGVDVFAMPRMHDFLKTNAPWSQLVDLKNIDLVPIYDEEVIRLSNVEIQPFIVPHRDEFSETVGYFIRGPIKSLLFIPDIDKWNNWSKSIVELVTNIDYALIDGTFYSSDELPGRDMSEIPHPFISESTELLKSVNDKVWFIHLNHTNPLLNNESLESQTIEQQGFHIARRGEVFEL